MILSKKLQPQDVDSYDLKVLSLGAGVQSSTLLYKMLNESMEMADVAIFADTGNEPKEVYDHLEKLKKISKGKLDLHVVNNGNIIDDVNENYIKMPVYSRNEKDKLSIGMRQCTKDYKLVPIMKKVREILDVKKLRNKKILMMMGISKDEIQRVNTPKNDYLFHYYPLIAMDMDRQDCLDYLSKNGYDKPPRSACIVCPYHSNEEWLDMKNNKPDEWKFAVDFDKRIRNLQNKKNLTNFIHWSGVSLDRVDLEKTSKHYQATMGDECEGMCGV